METGQRDQGLKAQLDVEKTYNQIVAKREAKLSRDALLERQATQLTKYFIRARQRELKDTVEKQAEQSRKHYERNLQKTKDAGEAAAAVAQMVQEEKIIISAHMAEKGRERMAQELHVKSERQEREKWQQARILYERFQAEERSKVRQEEEKQRLEKLQESLKKHDENIIQRRQSEAEKITTRREANSKRADRVQGVRRDLMKKRQKEARQTLSTGLRKMDAAEQRRLDLQVKVQEACREQLEVVIQKVDAAEKKKEEKRQAKHQKIIQKELELQERLRAREEEELEDEESSAEGHELSPRKQGVRGPSKESHHELRVVEPKKEEIQEEAPSPTSPKIMSYYSKELIVANSRAHKEYVQRCGKLQQAGFEMLAKKQFKVLADAAHIREDDAPAARMRSLHEKYLSENGKGRYKPPSGAVTARTPRRKVPTCGLCERHFPLESLIGSTLGKTLQKIKDSNDLPDLCSASQASGAMTCPTSPSATDRAPDAGTSQVEERILPGVRLYDTEVPLCAACYHRVRISSSSKA